MIEIKIISEKEKEDINIKNEPFTVFGRLIPSYADEKWTHSAVLLKKEEITEMCFPDENYDYDAMRDCVFIGAYDEEKCVGLAILKPGLFKYMYLYDFKVNKNFRGRHIGKSLIQKAKDVAEQKGYKGIYTQGQDTNLGACLFYLNAGFYIGGLDTNIYRHTKQEGKSDIIFYCETENRQKADHSPIMD